MPLIDRTHIQYSCVYLKSQNRSILDLETVQYSTVQYSCISLNIQKFLFSYIYQKFSRLVYIVWMLCDYKLAVWGGAQVDVPVLI